MCLLNISQAVGEEGAEVKLHKLFSGILVWRFKCGKMCHHQKEKSFVNNSVETLIREIRAY